MRAFLLLIIVAAVSLVAPATASAAKDQVVVTGSVVVGPQETTGDVVILDGPVTILGRVKGDVVAVAGA